MDISGVICQLHCSQTTISIELENQIFEEPANNYSQKYKKYMQCLEQICFPEKIKIKY